MSWTLGMAMDAMERLVIEQRAEIARLTAALQRIADDGKNCNDYCRKQAARALKDAKS